MVCIVPGKPVACNNGLLCLNYELLEDMVAHSFGPLGFPGRWYIHIYTSNRP